MIHVTNLTQPPVRQEGRCLQFTSRRGYGRNQGRTVRKWYCPASSPILPLLVCSDGPIPHCLELNKAFFFPHFLTVNWQPLASISYIHGKQNPGWRRSHGPRPHCDFTRDLIGSGTATFQMLSIVLSASSLPVKNIVWGQCPKKITCCCECLILSKVERDTGGRSG